GTELFAESGDGIEPGTNAGAHSIERLVCWSAEERLAAKPDVAAERDRPEALDLSLQIADAFIGTARVLGRLIRRRLLETCDGNVRVGRCRGSLGRGSRRSHR